MAKQTYHHGDLRQALMSAAARAIEESGPGALSLRDLARRAGVSHAAPAHHFGDKAGLLTALAAEGYGLLAAELAATRAATGSFLELGVTYVRFAVTHRAHFEVMFRRDLHRPDDPELAAARERAGDMLYAGAGQEASRGDGRFGEDGRLGGDGRLGEDEAAADSVRAAGVAAWSLAHGFATLWLNGSLSDLGADLDEAARTVLRRLRPGHDAS